MPPDGPAPASASLADTLAAAARAGEPDRYLAALLAPASARIDLLALAAFAGELGRISTLVQREPAMGEIRLQWWRDALDLPQTERTGNPIADALRDTVQRHRLPQATLLDLVDGRASDLESQPFVDDAALHAYLGHTEGALFALAARVLGAGGQADLQPLATNAGRSYGLARLLFAFPLTLSRGRVPFPLTRLDVAGVAPEDLLAGSGGREIAGLLAQMAEDSRTALEQFRSHVAKWPREYRAAFHPLALVEPYLRALQRVGGDPLRQQAEIAPLTRVYRVATAHWLGRY